MNSEFSTVHPDASLKEIQDLIIRGRLRILPVVENGKALGVITRTDLLTILLGNPRRQSLCMTPRRTPLWSGRKTWPGLW